MAEPKRGVCAPLFDKLTDTEPSVASEKRPLRVLGVEETLDSVAREVSTLLNTRSHRAAGLGAGTVLDYGLPDFGAMAARSVEDLHRLGESIRKRLLAWEPRLTDARVVLEPDPKYPQMLIGHVEARFSPELIEEPVAFEVRLGAPGAKTPGAAGPR